MVIQLSRLPDQLLKVNLIFPSLPFTLKQFQSVDLTFLMEFEKLVVSVNSDSHQLHLYQ